MLKLLWTTIKEHCRPLLLLILTLGTYFSIVFWKMLSFKPDGLYGGHVNVWSDWSLHIAIANTFAFKSPQYWFSYHPLYASGKFTYPFFTDFISGMLMRLGLSLKLSFMLPSVIFTIVLLVGMYLLFFLIVKSRKLAVMAVLIFFLSAGFGFIDYIKDFMANPSWSFLKYVPKDYGRYDNYQWYAGNMAVGLMIPQRAFLAGMTLGIWAIIGVFYTTIRDKYLLKSTKIKILAIAGVLAGILPVTHAHGFIAVVIISGILCFAHIKKWKLLSRYVVVAGVISSILFYIFIWGGIETDSFIKRHLGLSVDGDFFDWLRMWALIWGAMLPLAVLSLYVNRRTIRLSAMAVYLSGFTIFTVANLYLFQPIAWDNSKLFWWAYLIFSPLVAILLEKMWINRNLMFKLAAGLLFAVLIFLGTIELVRFIQTDKHSFQMTNNDDIKLGLTLREKTDPLAIFLTAPSHNHFVMIWGSRPILMGFTAWVWNFGFDYYSRESDMKKMFLGVSDVESLLYKYKISYVVIGPSEIYDLRANEEYYKINFPLAFSNDSYRIYDTRAIWRGDTE